MQHPLVRLITFLLAPLASLQASDVLGPVTNRPLVGVIRWDGYNGHPVVTKKQEMGFLKPEKWHSRAPWFFRKTGDSAHPLEFNPSYDKSIIRKITDEEIEYAASAGVDYWAFCYYAKYKGGWGLRDNFEAYLTSPLRSRIKSSIILLGEHVGKGLSSAASAAPDAAKRDWENLVNEIVPLLCDPSYQKVCGGRPLVYLMQPDELSKILGDAVGKSASVEKLRAAVTFLRERSQAAGAGDPYIVGMNAGGIWSAMHVDQAGLNAVSAYRGAFGSTPEGTPYAQLWDQICKNFIDGEIGLGSNPKREIVVPLMSGASHEPRHAAQPDQFSAGHYREPAPGEFKSHVLSGLDWAFLNKKNCPAQSVLIYAWNEHSEGGFICPTMGKPPDYKPNTRLLDELGAAIHEWRPKPN
ncbi:MAG: hypothetical protein QE267_07440 [Akkermansiaceae bacterium]|nr:hypothetical protein [Akkermansiaceae bacterium]